MVAACFLLQLALLTTIHIATFSGSICADLALPTDLSLSLSLQHHQHLSTRAAAEAVKLAFRRRLFTGAAGWPQPSQLLPP